MANALIEALRPEPVALLIAVAADLAIGDPAYALHPVRIIGNALAAIETFLRRAGADGYAGGIVLFLALSSASIVVVAAIVAGAGRAGPVWSSIAHVFFVYSFLALGDLARHVWRVEKALLVDDLSLARTRIAALVGRDVERMDASACRRAAIESLSENLTDGFTSPLFWYLLLGLPGLVTFKVVSTMDSMVGYKTPRYLQFGWCGARLDDVMNFLPARLTWLLIAGVAAVLPRCSGRKAFRVGLEQHGILRGPNSGWSEAATAGGIERRLVGPIWMKGALVTDLWIGVADDPPAGTHDDVVRALCLATATGLAAAAIVAALLVVSTTA
jgi:adenosylcobinamide-phosphate synthase